MTRKIGWRFFGSRGMNLNTIMGGTFIAHMTGSFPTSAVMRQSSETIAGSGLAAAETFRPGQEAVGPGQL